MDLLTVRPLAAFARSRPARRAAQSLVLLVAGAAVVHGLAGPSIAPRNLATVTTSIHWRGLLILGLLAAGNVFCAVCPMMLARDAARRVVTPTRRLPRWIRGKWIGLFLLLTALVTYEAYGLWERPAATAWIIIGYFVLALVVDLTFSGASFCKHVCPVGQFNFVASTVSPSEVRIRDAGTCQSCRTADCINGRHDAPAAQPLRGCEMGLFLPAKVGNLDCTFCFDCVRACPHDNVAVVTRVPAVEWVAAGHRSGIGRLQDRLDLVALAVLFTVAAPLAAFVMTTPGHQARAWIAGTFGLGPPWPVLALFTAAAIAGPALIGAVARVPRVFGDRHGATPLTATQLAVALVPIGFGIWVAHYGFHLLTGVLTIVPVTQSAVADLTGRAWVGAPAWQLAGMRPGLVFPLQIGCVLLGAFGSLGVVHAAVRREQPEAPASSMAPAIVLVIGLAVVALWILNQPMDMRGMGGG